MKCIMQLMFVCVLCTWEKRTKSLNSSCKPVCSNGGSKVELLDSRYDTLNYLNFSYPAIHKSLSINSKSTL
jgi:hypothetical protein